MSDTDARDTERFKSVSKQQIADDLAEYIKETPGVCAEGSAVGLTYLRHYDGEWQAVRYSSSSDRKSGFVEGTVLDEDKAVWWIKKNPTSIVLQKDAGSFTTNDTSIWADVDRQGVFDDVERCGWCGNSESETQLTAFETVEDGEVSLCQDCHESWDDAGENVGEVVA